MNISALWITKNEEDNIARSIESCKAIADEIVIVDTGSTDETLKIAEDFGARVEHFEWVNDFSAARNFALSKTNGDVVIFLDADEWFEPALTKKDGEAMVKAFKNNAILVLDIQRTNIDPGLGTVLEVDMVHRVMRGKGKAFYEGPIHEYVLAAPGQKSTSTVIQGLNIQHDGYSKENLPEKYVRNTELLQNALDNATRPMLQALYHYYLMRERSGLEQYDEAFSHAAWLVQNIPALKSFMKGYVTVGRAFPYQVLRILAPNRSKVSRRQLRAALVDTTKEIYSKYPIGKVYELYFNAAYDFEEEVLLQRLDTMVKQAELLADKDIEEVGDYQRICQRLYTLAGAAAWLYGDREPAFDYAAKAIQLSKANVLPQTIALLLRCVKGLPITDVVMFLNSMLPTDAPGIQEMLIAATQFEGYADLYTYYMKKMLDGGVAKKSDFWYLMIVLGRAEEACEAAMQAKDSTEPEVVQRTLFLAVASTGSIELFETYKEELGKYRESLDMMFYNQVGNSFNYGIVMQNYQLVAFAGGRPAANRLADIYGLEREAYLLRGRYYAAAGLYAEFLDECPYEPEPTDSSAMLLKAECELMCGRSQKALEIMEDIYEKAGVGDNYFNLCAALAHRGSPEVAAQARAIYNTYRPAFQRSVDYRDVINTEVILDSDSKKQRRELIQMTPEAFEKLSAPEELTPFPGQMDTLREAAGVYARHKVYSKAVDCLVEMFRYGDTSPMTRTALAEIFTILENEELAESLHRQVGQPAAQ